MPSLISPLREGEEVYLAKQIGGWEFVPHRDRSFPGCYYLSKAM